MSSVRPELQPLLSQFPPLQLDNVEAMRQAMAATPPAPIADDLLVENTTVDTADGHALRLRIYRPKEQTTILPGFLWIHGGGYVIGTPEADDVLCQRFVQEANCVVVSVDYRLAPEYPYPIPLEDCYTALKWMAEQSGPLQIDRTRLGIGGQSAGGGLTAALALLAKDRAEVPLIFQMPLYPMIHDANDTFSNKEITGNFIWNYSLNETGWSMYLGNLKGTNNIPYTAAPARATVEQLRGLPYTYTCIGQLDPFRDETLTYVTKLAQAGVDVDFQLYSGAYHGFETLNAHTEVAQRATQAYIDATKYALHRTME